MRAVKFPKASEIDESTWSANFTFPAAFVAEIKTRFPTWKDLHEGLERQDEAVVWGLLELRSKRLGKITPREIVESLESGSTADLLNRAKEAAEFSEYCKTIEPRYFPEKIRERARLDAEALESWRV